MAKRECQVCHEPVDEEDAHSPHDPDCTNHEGCDCDNIVCDHCCWECHPLQQDGDLDYTLAGQECWITVGDLSLHIQGDGGTGANVDIYELNKENDEPVTSLWAHRDGKDWIIP